MSQISEARIIASKIRETGLGTECYFDFLRSLRVAVRSKCFTLRWGQLMVEKARTIAPSCKEMGEPARKDCPNFNPLEDPIRQIIPKVDYLY